MVHTLCDDLGGKGRPGWYSVSYDKDLRVKCWDSVHEKVTSQFDYLLYTTCGAWSYMPPLAITP